MALVESQHTISEQEYLDGELISDIKHEYIDGQVYAMAGAHRHHVLLADTMSRKFGNHLENKPCQPYSSDMKVKIGKNYFYPDVLVDCTDFEGYFTETPTIIVEVLSNSTRQHDKTFKRDLYFSIPSLQEYVLIEQDIAEIEVWRRTDNNIWLQTAYYLGDEIHFASIGFTIAVEDIYQRVKNADMQTWLEKKQV
ncbi:MAG: Uma2 family endonuclease [Agitococcus sp.]|nr:Uma2 family endonuclease [Agitococcus sp.]MDO9177872.1 Uma2 family endonuclease [Agitococcus sp.]